jgi:hypothetical protein
VKAVNDGLSKQTIRLNGALNTSTFEDGRERTANDRLELDFLVRTAAGNLEWGVFYKVSFFFLPLETRIWTSPPSAFCSHSRAEREIFICRWREHGLVCTRAFSSCQMTREDAHRGALHRTPTASRTARRTKSEDATRRQPFSSTSYQA